MSAKKASAKKAEKPVVVEKPVVQNVPEYVDEGVTRPEVKSDPMDELLAPTEPTKQGKWIKVTQEQLETYEAKGLLVGFDPSNMEVKLKETL